MHYFVAMSLFIIVLQNVTVIKTMHNSKRIHGDNTKTVSDLDDVINNLVLREDYNENYQFVESTPMNKNEKYGKTVKEGVPFQRFMPVERIHDVRPKKEDKEIFDDITTKQSNGMKESDKTEFFENFKQKFKEHRFTLSPITVSIIISITILVTCCFTIWLRNRIIACFKKCWPSKKQRGYDPLDSESGKKDKISKFNKIKRKYSRFPSPRAKSLSKDYNAVKTVDNIQDVEQQSSAPPPPPSPPLPPRIIESASSTGCCTSICKSKKKPEKNK